MNIDDAIERFREHLEHERGLSARTVEAYCTDLGQLAAFVVKREGADVVDIASVEIADIRAFLAGELERGMSSRSMMRKTSSIRVFFRYLQKRGMVEQDPTAYLAQQIARKTIPTIVSEDRIGEMMRLPDEETLKGLRDRAVLEFLYGTGVRLGEMLALNVKDFLPLGETITVTGKGNKQRVVPFGGEARTSLMKYWSERFALANPPGEGALSARKSAPAFATEVTKRVSRRTVQRIVAHYIRQVAAVSATSPHTLRHAFATHLLDHGADMRAVQELLGHASLSTTQIYTHVSVEHLKRVHSKAHPRG